MSADLGNPMIIAGVLAQCLLLVLLLLRPVLTEWLRRRRGTSSPPPAPAQAPPPDDTGKHLLLTDQMAAQVSALHDALGVRQGRPSRLEEYLDAIKTCQQQQADAAHRQIQLLERQQEEIERARKMTGVAISKLEALERRAARGNGYGGHEG